MYFLIRQREPPMSSPVKTTLQFDPKAYPERILRLIMRKAEEWACPPSEALSRLLDKLADEVGVPKRDKERGAK